MDLDVINYKQQEIPLLLTSFNGYIEDISVTEHLVVDA